MRKSKKDISKVLSFSSGHLRKPDRLEIRKNRTILSTCSTSTQTDTFQQLCQQAMNQMRLPWFLYPTGLT